MPTDRLVLVTLATGVSQETFEVVLVRFATPLRALFALDTIFLVLYTTLLAGFAGPRAARSGARGHGTARARQGSARA